MRHLHLPGAGRLRAVLLTLLALGLLLLLFALWRYFSAARELQGNLAHIVHSGQLAPAAASQTRALLAADLARRALLAQQFHALMAAGAGLVLLSLAWLGVNLARLRRQRPPAALTRRKTSS